MGHFVGLYLGSLTGKGQNGYNLQCDRRVLVPAGEKLSNAVLTFSYFLLEIFFFFLFEATAVLVGRGWRPYCSQVGESAQ